MTTTGRITLKAPRSCGQTIAEYALRVLTAIVIAIITASGVLSGAAASSIDNAVTVVRSVS